MVATKRTAMAPTQEHETFMDMPDSVGPCTPRMQNLIQMSPYNQQQTTGELGKNWNWQQEQLHMDSLDEPSCAGRVSDPEERACFFMQKAQAITENINSCYKQHNLPQIDMTTIDKLKMRRMQFMDQEVAEQYFQPPTQTQQSCNVVTTMTVEQTIPDEAQEEQWPQQPTSRKDISFAEALTKLKAEVESLIQHRIHPMKH